MFSWTPPAAPGTTSHCDHGPTMGRPGHRPQAAASTWPGRAVPPVDTPAHRHPSWDRHVDKHCAWQEAPRRLAVEAMEETTPTHSPSQRSKGPHPRHVGDPAPMHRSHVEHSIRTPDTWGVARSPHWRSRARTVNAFNRSSAGVHRGLSRYDVFCRCCSGKLGWPCQEVLVFPLRGNWMTRLTAWRAWASLGQHFASVRGREHCLACGVGPPSPSSLAAPVYGLPALRCRSRLVAHASLPSVSPRRARQHTPGTQCTAAACTPPQQPSRTEFARVPATVDAGSNGCMTTKPSAASVSLPRSRSTTHSASTTVTTLARVDAFGEQSVP